MKGVNHQGQVFHFDILKCQNAEIRNQHIHFKKNGMLQLVFLHHQNE